MIPWYALRLYQLHTNTQTICQTNSGVKRDSFNIVTVD